MTPCGALRTSPPSSTIRFYKQTTLRTEAFTLYTEQLFCADTATQRGLCTEKLSHTDTFTHRGFYAKKLLHIEVLHIDALHKDDFARIKAQRRFYAQNRLHREAFAQNSFYTKKFLHRKALTQRSL